VIESSFDLFLRFSGKFLPLVLSICRQ